MLQQINTEAQIPKSLRKLPQWVSWRSDTKAPLIAGTSSPARVNDPDTWRPYTDLAPDENRGFVISSPYCGIDLDSCRDAESGELDQWAQKIVDHLGSYSEVSPSGTGVHVWVRARLAEDAPHKVGSADKASGLIEQYDSARYFTITGQRVEGSHTEIQKRQSQIDDLNIIAKIWKDDPGKSLWQNRNDNQDDSANDFALACKVIEHGVREPEDIERILRVSCLERPKWDTKRGKTTYIGLTITKALKDTASKTNGHKATAITDTLGVTRASDVEIEDVVWRWPGRLPVGKFVILEGDPAVGKSWLTLAIASAVSTGASLPGDSKASYTKRRTLIFSAEDGKADTLVPRLDGMSANRKRVFFADSVGADKHHPNLRDDIGAIEASIVENKIALVIIDPLNAYLEGTDGNKDISVRTALAPLAELAEKHAVMIMGVRHLRKGTADRGIYRGAGSMAFGAAARVVLTAGFDPDDPKKRILAVLKNNLAELPESLAYEIVEGQFHWLGASAVTAEQLSGPVDRNAGSSLKEAQEFLTEYLADGPTDSAELLKDAKANDISDATLKRAKKALGVKPSRIHNQSGKGGVERWTVELPVQLLDNFQVNEDGTVSWGRDE